MPELPEVETVRQQLLPLYQDEHITTAAVTAEALLQNTDSATFSNILADRKLKDITRKGKYLIFDCQDVFPVFHLGMSGIFLSDRTVSRYPQHIHVRIGFQSGKELFFQDVRRFGKIWLYLDFPDLPNLGQDPINQPVTTEDLTRMLQKRRTNLKLFLMDQGNIAGIGNIYASEILFDSRLSPNLRTEQLSPDDIRRLSQSIDKILDQAIKHFGTTYSAYQTVEGKSGDNQNFLKVYQREGESCYRCTGMIRKIIQGSRSTFYCDQCQAESF